MISVFVTNTKGGCGKTTIATNLAAAFAAGGLNTALADVDRQQSSLQWLKLRPETANNIEGHDWHKDTTKLGKRVHRLVIDAPAGLKMKHVDSLLEAADIVVVPVLPSIFDEVSTRDFLGRLEGLKPIRKQKKGVAVVANRLRHRSRAAQRLETFLEEIEQPVASRLSDRAIYGELAVQGQSIFDLGGRQGEELRAEWLPLLRAIESTG
ncbi:MAG: ParA family protein [Pseudomonadota bacterium]